MRYLFIFTFFFYLASAQNYNSQWYTIDDGLPQNSIKDIVKDKYGFIWLSTDNGLARYDGSCFTIFNKLPINNLNFNDFDGTISKDSILVRNNNEVNQILIKNKTVKVIPISERDKIADKIKEGYSVRLRKNIINSDYFENVKYFIKVNSDKYAFNDNYILYSGKDGRTKKISVSFTKNNLRNIFVNKEILFIADPIKRITYKIYKGNISQSSFPSLINDPNTKIYWQQITNQTFIINNNHIYLLVYKKNELELKHLVKYKDIGNFPFNSIFYDQYFDRLYLGSLNKGLNIIQLSQFYVARKNTPFADEVFYAALPYAKNKIITEEGIVFDHNGIVKTYDFGHNNDKYLMLYDNSKNILMRNKSYTHLIKFHQNSLYKISDSLNFNRSIISFSKKDNLYVLSLGNLNKTQLLIFKDDQFKKPIYKFDFKTFVNTFCRYGKNEILIGCNNGLYISSLKNNKTKIIDSQVNVKSIIKTKDQNIWIITRSGFYLLKSNRLIKMPADKKKYLDSAHYILEDSFGYLWISSNNGLFKVQKNQLLQYANNPKTKVHYYRFVKENGFLINEFNGSSSPNAQILENGEFVFPSMDGFVFFTPKNIKSFYPNEKNIYIERARINNGEISYFQDTLALENNYKLADIFIDIPYYSNSDNLCIDAKIGNDTDTKWDIVNFEKERKYTISNLEPGNYILYFRILLSPNGNYKYKKINISIKPLFYQTFFFKISLVFLMVIIIVLLIQLRTNFLRLKNKNLQEIVENQNIELEETSIDLKSTKNKLNFELDYRDKLFKSINHDISTPISFIIYLSKKVLEINDIELQKKYFNSIYQSAEELYKFTNSLKEYGQLHNENDQNTNERIKIYDDIENKVLLFREIALQNKTIIHNNTDSKLIRINKTIFGVIIHNLLDNAVKNTQYGEIFFSSMLDVNTISIQISDTGIGMSEEQINYYNTISESLNYDGFTLKKFGIGLHLVIYLIQKINSNIKFAQNFPSGTIITINLKIN